MVGGLFGMEQDVIAVGTVEPLVELDGKVKARRQAGKRTGEGDFPVVQIEGERTRDLVDRQRATEVDEVRNGRAGVRGRLTVEHPTASLLGEGSAITGSQEGVARGALSRHRERNVFPAVRVRVTPPRGKLLQGLLCPGALLMLGDRHSSSRSTWQGNRCGPARSPRRRRRSRCL